MSLNFIITKSPSFYVINSMIIYTVRAYSRKAGHVCGITKKRERKFSKRAQLRFFPSKFYKFRAFRMPQPFLNKMWFWRFLQKMSYFIIQKGHCIRVPQAISAWKNPLTVLPNWNTNYLSNKSSSSLTSWNNYCKLHKIYLENDEW